MQLNDILEENSVKAISAKTKISEENLENLFNKNFETLKKVKALGFISILEREYGADLANLRQDAYEYYGDRTEDQSIALGLQPSEEKKGTSKFLIFLIVLLLGASSWYFLTQIDKKNVSEFLPFLDESTIDSFMGQKDDTEAVVGNLSIAKVSKDEALESRPEESGETVVPAAKEATLIEDKSVEITQSVTDITPTTEDENVPVTEETPTTLISIVPVNRLWFGLINTETKERKHFSTSLAYDLEIGEEGWLLATSSAPFSIVSAKEIKEFNDAKEHYFKIDKNGIVPLDKSEYVARGGWAKW